MRTTFLKAFVVATAAFLTTAQADHMSPWEAGWANMPNDIHNTRLDTRGETSAFLEFIRYGEGADSVNRFLLEEAAVLEAETAAGHQLERLSARLDPLEGFLGGGWAQYSVFDAEPAVAAALSVNVRLRLVRSSGAVANEALLGLPEYAADPDTTVTAGFRTRDGNGYALCRLAYEALIVGDDGIAQYAVYGLSLKADRSGLVEGTGACVAVDADGTPVPDEAVLPAVAAGDLVDIAVKTPPMTGSLAVLMGGF